MGNAPTPAPKHHFDVNFVGKYSGAFSEKYRILERVGAGAEGVAYLVEKQSKSKYQRASFLRDGPPELFIAKQTKDMSPEGKRVFLEEFEKMRLLQHPHCIKVIELVDGKDWLNGRLCDQTYVISELANGRDLFKYVNCMLDAVDFVDERWVAKVFAQAMQGVAFMHDKGIVHNDLKPDNILVMDAFDPNDPGRVPVVKVSDFGCATVARDTDFSFGDPRYQSPETWRRIVQVVERRRKANDFYKMSPEADVWSLGVTLYELLSGGKIPFLYRHASLSDVMDHSEVWQELRDGIESQEVEIRKHCTDISAEVGELLASMLRKNPQARPSVTQLLQHPWFGMTEQRALHGEALSALSLNQTKDLAQSILLNALVTKMKSDHLRECWAAFQAVDDDFSGSINLQEFIAAMSKLGRDHSEAEVLFQSADVDRDGKLVFTEFSAVTFDWKSLEKSALDTALHNLFQHIDSNMSGWVNERELTALFHGVVDPRSISELFTQMDFDGDGKISLNEFVRFLQPCSEDLAASFGSHVLRTRRQSRHNAAKTPCAGCAAWLAQIQQRRLRARCSQASGKNMAASVWAPNEVTDRRQRLGGQALHQLSLTRALHGWGCPGMAGSHRSNRELSELGF